MKINITSDADLNSLLDAIAEDITDSYCNYRLFCKIGEASIEFATEIAQSNTFWHLTTRALQESALIQLCRVYDQGEKNLSLVNLLDTLKANLCRFSEDEFRTRLFANGYVDSLAKYNRIPPAEEIEADIKLVTNEQAAVGKLTKWRNNVIAHRSAKFSMGKIQVLVENPLSQQDIVSLLENALSTFNKYSNLFRASTYSPAMVGQDDYMDVLNYIRLGLSQHRAAQKVFKQTNLF
jgi:hypothetical protein